MCRWGDYAAALSLGPVLLALLLSCAPRTLQQRAHQDTQEALHDAESEEGRLEQLEAEKEALTRQVEGLEQQLQTVRNKIRQTEDARVAIRDQLLKLKIEQEQQRSRGRSRPEQPQVKGRLRDLLAELETLIRGLP